MSGNGKKGLWIALAISIFVLIVFGAAIFIFAPSKSAQATPLDLSGKAQAKAENPSDYLQGEPGVTGDLTVSPPPSESGTTPSATGQTTTTNSSGDIIILYGDNTKTNQTSSSPAQGQAAATGATSQPAQSTKTTQTVVTPPPVTPPPVTPPPVTPTKTTTTSTPQKQATEKPIAKPSVKPAATSATSGGYFIQAGSFRTKSTADSLLSDLQKKNLQGKVSVKDIDGVSYYQVKVGPFSTRDEAKQSLKAVLAVPGVSAQAFITQ
ncbi:MAG TPA: SPOR domain-containing protein [Spirochaetales bacterium]|nr:SPOR domain-containing protein [Spirochaetales bacterium]